MENEEFSWSKVLESHRKYSSGEDLADSIGLIVIMFLVVLVLII